MQHLENDGKLIPKDRKNIIAAAGHMISISGRYNDEAKKVLAALAKVA
jgi:hypothetical protein